MSAPQNHPVILEAINHQTDLCPASIGHKYGEAV
jgi:hypothetical protein